MASSQDSRLARSLARLDGKLPPYIVRPRDTWRERKRQPQRPVSLAWALARGQNRQTDHSYRELAARELAAHRRHTRVRRGIAVASKRRNRRGA